MNNVRYKAVITCTDPEDDWFFSKEILLNPETEDFNHAVAQANSLINHMAGEGVTLEILSMEKLVLGHCPECGEPMEVATE